MRIFSYTQKRITVVVALALAGLLLVAVPVFSQVTGPCVGCHTMHNSQNGQPMATNADGSPDATPNAKLLRRDGCLGCHSGTYTAGTGLAAIPKVLGLTAPVGTLTDCAAGGNFYWVGQASGDVYGHNVGYVTGSDPNFTNNVPPGYNNTFIGAGGLARGPFTATDQLTCAGTFGCHGDPNVANDFGALTGAHHGVENANGFSDGTTIAKSYRFLYGIYGEEDADWEYTKGVSDHNQYDGKDRANNGDADIHTISHLCCECHGDFHAADSGTTTFGSPWIRHPTDFDMTGATGTEYAHYNNNGGGGTDGVYSTLAPVGSDMSGLSSSSAGGTQVVQNVLTDTMPDGVTDIAIVTCISCHRAHGSEYADLLRWDYSTISAGSGVNTNIGCFVCHTTKDDNM